MDLDGHVLGAFGKAGKRRGQFGWVREMLSAGEHPLVGDILNWRVQKLLLYPQ